MIVCFASHQAAALTHGGIRTQMQQTRAALEALGVTVVEYDMWTPTDLSAVDLVHLFTANIATYHLARALRFRDVPFVVSPVFYTRRPSAVVRSVVAVDRLVNRAVRGIWTDYGLMSEMCRWAARVLPNTGAEARLFIEGLGIPAPRVTVVPNGVEDRFQAATPDLYRKEYGSNPFVLSVTHIGPERKNALRLIEALEGIDRNAVIVGPIDDSPAGEACVERAKRNSRLSLLGPLAHDSELLASAYAAADAFVLPSAFETPGVAALEAAAAGTRIVITGQGGTREYFGSHAEYVNPASAADIRHGILRALGKPVPASLRGEIVSRYAWRQVADQTRAVYESIIGG